MNFDFSFLEQKVPNVPVFDFSFLKNNTRPRPQVVEPPLKPVPPPQPFPKPKSPPLRPYIGPEPLPTFAFLAGKTKKRFREEIEDNYIQPQEKKRRTEVRKLSKSVISTYVELLMNIRPDSCFYVDPTKMFGVLITKSVHISILALFSCAKYNISLEALLKTWWQTIARAKEIYWAKGYETIPAAERVRMVWEAIKQNVQYCYDVGAVNFLYDMHLFGRCQCSCGTVALREIMLQVDPNLPVWYIYQPNHILIGTIFNPTDPRCVAIETTNTYDLTFCDPLAPTDQTHFQMKKVLNINGFNAYEWLREAEKLTEWDPVKKSFKVVKLSFTEQLYYYAKMAKLANLDYDSVPRNNSYQLGFLCFTTVCRYRQEKSIELFDTYRQKLITGIEIILDKYNTEPPDFEKKFRMEYWQLLLEDVKSIKIDE